MERTLKVSRRTLERALERVGDPERLAALLGVSLHELDHWLNGCELPPHAVFVRALEALYGNPPGDRRGTA